jgi:hypothetical protein
MSAQQDHFEIDETENLIDNLEMVANFHDAAITYRWKWVTIALHQALYGALIATLRGTDPRQTVVDRKRKSGKAVMLHVDGVAIDEIATKLGESEERIRCWITRPYLISFDEALRRVRDKASLPSVHNAQPLATTPQEDDAIETLTQGLRNEFEHFVPKAWLVFTDGMPAVVRNVLRVISFLVFESNCVAFSDEQEQRIQKALSGIERTLSS